MQIAVIADEVIVKAVLPERAGDAASLERPGEVTLECRDHCGKIGVGRFEQPMQMIGQDDMGVVAEWMLVTRTVHRSRHLHSALHEPRTPTVRNQGDEYRVGPIITAVIGHAGQHSTV